MSEIDSKYRPDYKTADPNWWNPPNPAMKGDNLEVKFKKLHEKAVLPEYKTAEAAGMDLSSVEEVEILPASKAGMLGVRLVSTGLAMAIPVGFEGQIRPRSGLAAKHGITVLNSPGTIDSDYRGEVKVILINHGSNTFVVKPGDRIAQLVIAKVEQAKVREVDQLDETVRGEGGFGSTDVK